MTRGRPPTYEAFLAGMVGLPHLSMFADLRRQALCCVGSAKANRASARATNCR